ncbi:MAG: SIS domain-containing protein [Myxococcales bacterium]|nr:SIS domain-containing protein [Myxococcales bacterium]MCB9716724.1 SIS domain-containing protein [Myxococcales bacterium]
MQPRAATIAFDLESVIDDHLRGVAELLSRVPVDAVADAVRALELTRHRGGTAYLMGNGGSSATALHLANDLSATTARMPPGLRVACLNANMSTFSALANDTGYDNVFVGQLGLLEARDLVLVISASGNSGNCVRAVEHARAVGAPSVGLLGFDGGRLAELCDVVVHVPRHDYLSAEDAHSVICHALARALGQGPANAAE